MENKDKNNVVSLVGRKAKPAEPSFTVNEMTDKARLERSRTKQPMTTDEKIRAALETHGSHKGEAQRKKPKVQEDGDVS